MAGGIPSLPRWAWVAKTVLARPDGIQPPGIGGKLRKALLPLDPSNRLSLATTSGALNTAAANPPQLL
jgi:hypothetical protein